MILTSVSRRYGVLGSVAGLIVAPVLAAENAHLGFAVAAGIVAGGVYGIAQRGPLPSYSVAVMSAGAFGVLAWIMSSVLLEPLAYGMPARWSVEGMRAVLVQLEAWIVFGIVLGAVLRAGEAFAQRAFPLPAAAVVAARDRTRIVILGGGFAGITTAKELERRFGADPRVDITLVSDTNALLFTPMLAEVAGGSLEATHISTPARTSLHRTTFLRARITAIDLERRTVGTAEVELAYDHLVLALGANSNYLGLDGVQEHAFDFKSLSDAVSIRNRVIDTFERADRAVDPAVRRRLLTFVVAGGGFAGAEVAGALNDFARGIVADYPRLRATDVRVVVVHSRERILPELSAGLADYALQRMTARGVSFCLNARVAGAGPGFVRLSGADDIEAETLVWTAGTMPNPLIATLDIARDKRGAAIVEATLAVAGRPGLWALGDCACVPDVQNGGTCPPTAQFALREAATVARNIHAVFEHRPTVPFRFTTLGALCVVGYQTACAEITSPFDSKKALRFSGFFAWFLWRAIYLSKLPGFERKLRVAIDWTIELFFPRDIVQTLEIGGRR